MVIVITMHDIVFCCSLILSIENGNYSFELCAYNVYIVGISITFVVQQL